ncbi:ImmA/IrrE family metallo-endopeptidase [Arcanobacterium hippocoleae]
MRLVSDKRYEELRQIGADIIEDYAFSYPLNPYEMAAQFGCEIVFYSRQVLSKLSDIEFEFTCSDGMSFRFVEGNNYRYKVALHSSEQSPRSQFTLMHEIAHIVLNHHGSDAPNEELEQEANFLASFLIMPEILALWICKYKYGNESFDWIADFCGVSAECANWMQNRIQKRKKRSKTILPYEKQILDSVQNGIIKIS